MLSEVIYVQKPQSTLLSGQPNITIRIDEYNLNIYKTEILELRQSKEGFFPVIIYCTKLEPNHWDGLCKENIMISFG